LGKKPELKEKILMIFDESPMSDDAAEGTEEAAADAPAEGGEAADAPAEGGEAAEGGEEAAAE